MCLHPPLQGPAGVRVLGRRLGMVGGGGGSLAGLVKLHVAVLLAAAADAAVALGVEEGAAVAHGAALELTLAQLDGAAAHAQHEALAVVVEAALPAQGAVDVGEGHAGGHTLLVGRAQVGRAARQRDGWGGVVLLEGVDAVVAIGGVLGSGKRGGQVGGAHPTRVCQHSGHPPGSSTQDTPTHRPCRASHAAQLPLNWGRGRHGGLLPNTLSFLSPRRRWDQQTALWVPEHPSLCRDGPSVWGTWHEDRKPGSSTAG